jgi:metal-responsive CopG/Arc/MetJ family transcriptional regulator
MARQQVLVQLTDRLLAALDEEVTRSGRSRSEVIREAVERYLETALEADIDRAIIEGYRRVPPEDIWGDTLARALIAADPW